MQTHTRRVVRRHWVFVPISLCLGWGKPADAQPQPWDVQGRAAQLRCGALPLLLTGDHQDLTVTGPCRYVRVAGRHNDISIDVAPGGTIEITGAHNDVTWHIPPGTLASPQLLDHGVSNSFHND